MTWFEYAVMFDCFVVDLDDVVCECECVCVCVTITNDKNGFYSTVVVFSSNFTNSTFS